MLRELIPGDLVKVQSSNDWKRSIIAAYNQDAGEILFQLNLNALFYIRFSIWFMIFNEKLCNQFFR